MNVVEVNREICEMLGVKAATAQAVQLTLRHDSPPLVLVETVVMDPVIGPRRFELAPLGTCGHLVALLALAHQYAGECGDCAGARVCPDDEPCTACADVWAVIDKAEGRT